MATLDELGAFVASACSLTLGTTVFLGMMPSAPDACIALYEYPGLGPDFVFGQSAVSLESPRVQVLVRGAKSDYEAPRAVAETAYRACAAAGAQLISGTRYLRIAPLQSPFRLGTDDNGRVLIAFNLQVEKGLSA